MRSATCGNPPTCRSVATSGATWGAGDRSPERGGQDANVVAAGPQILDHLPAAHLVAAQGVGRIEVADHQNFQAATSHARAIKGS